MLKQILLFWVISFLSACAVPQRYWPQKNISAEIIGNHQADEKYLLASSESEFKKVLIEEIKDEFSSSSQYLEIIGIDQLETINPKEYRKIIVIGTCLSWGLEYKVQEFLDEINNKDKIIIIATSGDGNWLPNKYEKKMDALSTASKVNLVPTLMFKLKEFLE